MTDDRPPEPTDPPAGDEAPTREAPAPPPRAARRFLRSRDERVIGGVAGGLAAAIGVDPWVVRLGFVLTAAFGGAGVVAYLVGLAFVPEDAGDGTPAARPPMNASRAVQGAGLVTLAVAALIVLDDGFGPGWMLGPNLLITALLAGLAFAAYRGLSQDDDRTRSTATRIAGGVLLAVTVLAVGGVALVSAFWLAATGGGTAAAIVVLGLGLTAAVAAFVRPVRWLAPFAVVLAIPVAVVAAADVDIDGGIGERTYRPVTLQDLPADGFDHGAGELVVDLREMPWPRSGVVEIEADMGVGQLMVLVPRGVCVQATADIGVGALTLFGEETGGIDLEHQLRTGRAGATPRLVLDADLGIGHVQIDTRRDPRGPFDDPDEDGPVILPPSEPEAPAPLRGECG